ncbi:MAG: hypothetical protein ACR2IN_05425 [Thermoleophilaceae bacterium]
MRTAAWRLGMRLGLGLAVPRGERRLGVEAQPAARTVTDADGAEALGVVVDPRASNAEEVGQLGGIEQARGQGGGVLVGQELDDAAGDGFDGGGREGHGLGHAALRRVGRDARRHARSCVQPAGSLASAHESQIGRWVASRAAACQRPAVTGTNPVQREHVAVPEQRAKT